MYTESNTIISNATPQPIPAQENKEFSTYSWEGRAYNQHAGMPDTVGSTLSLALNMWRFLSFSGQGWGETAPNGGSQFMPYLAIEAKNVGV